LLIFVAWVAASTVNNSGCAQIVDKDTFALDMPTSSERHTGAAKGGAHVWKPPSARFLCLWTACYPTMRLATIRASARPSIRDCS
jgi:hypothetical protein